MVKVRTDHYAALGALIDGLGMARCMEITGKSRDMHNKWANMDADQEISLKRALDLNDAYAQMTGENVLLALVMHLTAL